jgi:hypothetical protein
MKKRLNLTIDAEVYDMIKELPRKVSISEVVSFVLNALYKEFKLRRELTQEEIDKWIEKTPEGRDFRHRLTEHWGPSIKKIDETFNKVKKTVKGREKK